MNAIVEHLENSIEALIKDRDELQEKIIAMCKAIPDYDWSGDSEKRIANLAKERDEQRHAADHWMTEAVRYHNALQKLAAAHKLEREKHCNCEFEGDENTVQCTLHNAWAEALHEQAGFRRERDALAAERDGLKAARYAYATEFPLNEEGQPDVGSIHQNIRALKAAGKFALDALVSESRTTQSNVTLAKILTAITLLRKAGVQ